MNEDENSFPNFHFLEELVIKGVINCKTMDKVKIGTSVLEKKYKKKETKYFDHENLCNKINIYLNSVNNLSEPEKEDIKKSIFKKINNYNRLLRQKLTEKRFEIITDIGQGSLGNVYLVRDKLNNKIYAMKKLNIPAIIRNSQIFHIKIEKDILSMNSDNIWQTKLFYSFIEGDYLYYIIEHCPGGDLLSYFDMKDYLTEEEARFYIAEIILGVESLHKNKCIHRDIKPENIFIDKFGHLKLGDFGLSIISNNIMYPYTYKWKNSNDEIHNGNIKNEKDNKKIIGFSKVGSLLYLAPEVVENKGYGEEIDWWSVGIIFYEMLFGMTPFFEGTQEQIIDKIKNFKKYLVVPDKVENKNISKEARKLIYDFLEYKDKRLGLNGIDEIKRHPFFKNFDWDNIRNTKPPFIPKPLRIKELDLELNLKNNRLGLYTSKEIQNREYNNLKNYLYKMNLNIYDFYYNKELEEIKYNLNNNIIELIKKQVINYSKKKNEQKNILDEISTTEDITSIPSGESAKKIIENRNLYNSTNIYNTERKNKYSFFAFDKIDNAENKILKKKKAIQIIPIRNLLFNNSKISASKDKKELLYNSIRFGSSIKNKLISNNNPINTRSESKNKKYLMTEKKYMSKSIFKEDNNLNNTEMKIKNYSKLKDMQIKNENNINNIKPYHEHNEHYDLNKKKNMDTNEMRKIKINGKLFMVKKNLGKYYS